MVWTCSVWWISVNSTLNCFLLSPYKCSTRFLFADKPTVSSYPRSPYNITEKMTAYITCTIKDANPKTNIMWLWSVNGIAVDVPLSKYTIPNIQRNMSGTYSCKAKNSAGISLAASTFVDVQCEFFFLQDLQHFCRINISLKN